MIIGSIVLVLSALLAIVAPIGVGDSINNSIENKQSAKKDKVEIISIIIGWLFTKLSFTKYLLELIYVVIHKLICFIGFKLLNLIYDIIPKDKDGDRVEYSFSYDNYEDNTKTMSCLIAICITLSIISGLFMIIVGFIFPYESTEVTDIIFSSLENGKFDFKIILEILIESSSVLMEIVQEDNYIIKICIVTILCVMYISCIYYGIKSINQHDSKNVRIPIINKNIGIAFNVQAITIKNVCISILIMIIVLSILSKVPIVDTVSTIIVFLNIFNIEISTASIVVVAVPVVVEKSINYTYKIMHGDLEKSDAFSKYK